MVTAKPHRSRHVGIKVMAASASWWRRSRLVTDDNSWIHQTVSDYRQRGESRMITAEVWQGGQKGFLALLAITVSTAKKGSTSNNPSSPPLPWILSYLHKISSTWPDFGFNMSMISYFPKKRNSPNRQQPPSESLLSGSTNTNQRLHYLSSIISKNWLQLSPSWNYWHFNVGKVEGGREQVQGWRYCPLQRQRRKMEQNDK